MLTVGTILQYGKYKIDEVLAVKGSSVTYRATQDQRKQPVIIRTAIASSAAADREIRRFLAAARRLAQLRHPHIVRIDDCFVEENQLCLVTDFIAGQPLSQKISAGPTPVAEALHYVRQIAQAVLLLHRQGILYYSIKPSSIMLCEDAQQATLIDFDMACMSATSAIRSMPESEGSEELITSPALSRQTVAADIYGLAATLYALVTGSNLPVDSTGAPIHQRSACRLALVPDLAPAIAAGLADASSRPSDLTEWLALLPTEQEADDASVAPSRQFSREPAKTGSLTVAALSISSEPDVMSKPAPQQSSPQQAIVQANVRAKRPRSRLSGQQNSFPKRALAWSAVAAGLSGAGLGFLIKPWLSNLLPLRQSALLIQSMPSKNIEETFPPKVTETPQTFPSIGEPELSTGDTSSDLPEPSVDALPTAPSGTADAQILPSPVSPVPESEAPHANALSPSSVPSVPSAPSALLAPSVPSLPVPADSPSAGPTSVLSPRAETGSQTEPFMQGNFSRAAFPSKPSVP